MRALSLKRPRFQRWRYRIVLMSRLWLVKIRISLVPPGESAAAISTHMHEFCRLQGSCRSFLKKLIFERLRSSRTARTKVEHACWCLRSSSIWFAWVARLQCRTFVKTFWVCQTWSGSRNTCWQTNFFILLQLCFVRLPTPPFRHEPRPSTPASTDEEAQGILIVPFYNHYCIATRAEDIHKRSTSPGKLLQLQISGSVYPGRSCIECSVEFRSSTWYRKPTPTLSLINNITHPTPSVTRSMQQHHAI